MNPENLKNALTWRYATKKFDADKKVPAETWAALENALLLSPSSFGLQPWRFLVVTDPVMRENLLPNAWNQAQVVDASHLVVFASQRRVGDEDVDRLLNLTASLRSTPPESLHGYRQMIRGFLANMGVGQMEAWTTHQTYLALGQLMTSAAVMGVDTCPLEGIMPGEFDRLLGLEGSNFRTVVACAVGYRHPDDQYADLVKVRYSPDEVIQRIE